MGDRHNLAIFLVARALSAVGTWMAPMALTFLLLDEHYQLVVVGLVLAARSIPTAVLSLAGGLAADRFGPRRMMVIGDLVRFASHGLLFAAVLMGRVPLAGFVVAELVIGLGAAFFTPSLTGLIPRIVPADQLAKANGARGLVYSVAMIVCPAAAGFLISVWSPTVVIGLDAVAYLASAGALGLLVVASVPARVRVSVWADIKGGLSAIRERAWLWETMAIYAVFGMVAYGGLMLLGPAIARTHLGGASSWGLLLSGLGIGTALGSVLAMRITSKRPILVVVGLGGLWAIPMIALAGGLPLPALVLAAGLGGLGWGIVNPVWYSTIQQQVPQEHLSQVSAWDTTITEAATPIGYLLVGALAGIASPITVLMICAIVWLAICVAGMSLSTTRRTFNFAKSML